MKLYNFTRLIQKYSLDFTVHQKKGGEYVAGKWVDGEPVVTPMRGAVVPLSEKKIYDSGGTYTTQDRELYLTRRLDGDLSALTVCFKGNTYAVEESRNFEDYADVAVYVLKWISKGAETNA